MKVKMLDKKILQLEVALKFIACLKKIIYI